MKDGLLKNVIKWIIKSVTKPKHDRYIKDVMKRGNDLGDITLFTSDCIGGLIYHSLGKKFCSPTINISIEDGMFINFVAHYNEYLNEEITAIDEPDVGYPVGILGKDSLYGGVRIAFEHYKTLEHGIEKWNSRKTRIISEEIYVICADRDLNDQEIELFRSIKCKRKIMFTWNPERADGKEIFAVKKYGRQRIKNYSKLRRDGFRDYEIFFDYVSWLQMKDDFMLEELE